MNKPDKFLPFDALEGYKDHIRKASANRKRISMPILSEDQLDSLDILIMDCYNEHTYINVDYYDDGYIVRYSGVIEDIDTIKAEIILDSKEHLKIKQITRILT